VAGARVNVTGKEYKILELLSLRKGSTLTKEMFLNHLYGGMDEPVEEPSTASEADIPPNAQLFSGIEADCRRSWNVNAAPMKTAVARKSSKLNQVKHTITHQLR
jgi:hypothetical protein